MRSKSLVCVGWPCSEKIIARNGTQIDGKRVAKDGTLVSGKPKEFKCPQCDKAYLTEKKLNKHIRIIHEEQKVNKCETCGKEFGKLTRLKAHIKNVHEWQVHVCDLCGKGFNGYRWVTRLKLLSDPWPQVISSNIQTFTNFSCGIVRHYLF